MNEQEITHRYLAESIISQHNAMTLGIVDGDGFPWLAPVYYVHKDFHFYFFSDPASRHASVLALTEGYPSVSASAAIYNEPDEYGHIQGLQMKGHLERVTGRGDRARVMTAFGLRFSFFARFLQEPRLLKSLQKNEIYQFTAREVWITDNSRLGYGHRICFHP
ncbi:pyridoxamine 5'-phosphate oxidase family protein [Heliobacterium chlorum]|uniref:Pyridoxamine 5'-phosphate oxidase family protein n=1 Tax=Heliobacterium chlorum TaxID=2698 RepID=A0ABR7T442_HELCL|nr:pyridoxamine 5'-phosphate oxidase family protein [Heliobacterium chlorum]